MYLDVKGLVTTGVGNLIDSVYQAQQLPWKRKDGTRASSIEIANEWQILKMRQDLSRLHYKHAGNLCDLRLTDADIDALVARKLESNSEEIAEHFPGWPTFPADAQLAILSLAWAVGPSFAPKWPNLSEAIRAKDWVACASHMVIKSEGNPGVIPRNQLNREHLIAAASKLAREYPDVLHGPCTLAALRAGWKQIDETPDPENAA